MARKRRLVTALNVVERDWISERMAEANLMETRFAIDPRTL
jgi:hypothetical protein